MAIVAYRQPVLRAEIEAVRGAACGEILRQLMQRDLVRISGRSEELGKPYLYSTTNRFLQMFGLQSLESLPHAEWFKQAHVEPGMVNDQAHPTIPDSADKESKVSIRMAAAVLENDSMLEDAAGIRLPSLLPL